MQVQCLVILSLWLNYVYTDIDVNIINILNMLAI